MMLYNIFMKNNLTREELNKMGVYQLRCVARNLGITYASRFKAEELKNIILENKHYKKTNRGRPSKVVNLYSDIIDLYTINKSDAVKLKNFLIALNDLFEIKDKENVLELVKDTINKIKFS